MKDSTRDFILFSIYITRYIYQKQSVGPRENRKMVSLLCLAACLSASAAATVKPSPPPKIKLKKVPPAKAFVRTPTSLDQKILDILACASTNVSNGLVGIQAVELRTGKVLHEQNSQNAFSPASNTKLFSTALALSRLGPDHTFETRLAADHQPDETGKLRGNIYLIGGGDPTLGSRRFARLYYSGNSEATTPPKDAIEQFADAIVEKGIRHIQGDIVGDETRFPRDLYPVGWSIDDSVAEHGAPVSALTYHDNAQVLTVSPWSIRYTPKIEYFTIFNQIRAAAPGAAEDADVRVERMGGSRQLILTGKVPSNHAVAELVAVDDPALFAASILYDALTRRGVRIDGVASTRSRRHGDAPLEGAVVELASRKSAPLIDILRVVDKISHNLFAELVLREVALVASGEGTRQAANRELSKFLWQTGVNPECCYFQDGSGLSRQTLVTPQAVTRVLAHMYKSEHREAWLSLLPIGGVDGTLTKRFEEDKENGKRIHAKTGSLAHVATLSGYAFSKTHGEVAFSILFNNYNGLASEVRSIIDKIALALAE
jgi:D-alanyl-D-alanine carboxypeptidase/D-alanyl-D-alanine-endopeptidase (penicillin-binding protein 4)